MAPSTRGPQPPQPLTEFHFFRSLPPELRLIIWNQVMDHARRTIRINAREVTRQAVGRNLPPGVTPPSDTDPMSNDYWPFSESIIERIYPEKSPLPHQLLFACRESHHLALERYKLCWEYTPLSSTRYSYHYIPHSNETWESSKDQVVPPIETRRHFRIEEKASQWMKQTFMDLKNDIVYLVPETNAYLESVRLDIMARWFPFLPNIQYLCVTFESLWLTLVSEQARPGKPRYLTKFKGLSQLIVTLQDWTPQSMGIHPDYRDAFDKNKARFKISKVIMNIHFKRLEKEVPGWKRPKLRLILDDKELQDM
jgi:hypothetical protein